VQLTCEKRLTQWGYSLWSFQVYGNEIDEDLPMIQKILKKWDKKLPKSDVTVVDERKVPWLQTSAPTATGK
jgi:hypothetical protein